MIKTTLPGMVADKPNVNNVVFTEDCLRKMIEREQAKVQEGKLFVHSKYGDQRLADVVAVVRDMRFDDERHQILYDIDFIEGSVGAKVMIGALLQKIDITLGGCFEAEPVKHEGDTQIVHDAKLIYLVPLMGLLGTMFFQEAVE